MARPIAYDVLRLMLGPMHETPRGIDRIDFGIANSLHAVWPEAFNGIALMPWGLRYFGRKKLAEHGDLLRTLWRERVARDEDPVYQRLKRFLTDPGRVSETPLLQSPRWAADLRGSVRLVRFMTQSGKWELGRRLRTLPRNSLYLSVGHYGLGTPALLSWLDDRPDVASIFMLHDVIPLEAPELVAPSSQRLHQRALATILRRASALIAPSEAAKQAILAELRRRGSPDLPIYPVSSPVDEAFTTPAQPDPDLALRPYFVICGAIEARKNHLLLLHVWRDMVLHHGKNAPALIIIGTPGFGYDAIRYYIKHCRPLHDFVHVAIGLSTPALRTVTAGARALLMPSFAEGFGLPPVEALTVGTPVLLSNIPAHRESVGDFGIFLEPTDGPGWRRHIEAMIEDTPEYQALRARVATFRPKTWKQYMSEIQDILLSFG
jgi:glycosyltransferase involved in cell wall biosynthesis